MIRVFMLATGVLWATLCGQSASASESGERISCGEFCVQLVCEYYDVDYAREEALAILEPGEFGETSLEQVKQCLSGFGFESEGMTGTFDEVIKGHECPMVAFIKASPNDVVGHFVLTFYDSEQDSVIVFDRLLSDRPVTISREKFTSLWTGVVLPVSLTTSSGYSMTWTIGVLALGLALLAFSFRRGRQPSGSAIRVLVISLCLGQGGICVGADNLLANKRPVRRAGSHLSSEQQKVEPIIVTQRSADLGTLKDIKNESDFCVVFRWTNESGKELTVSKVIPSCGCSGVEYSRDPLKAGETTDFVVKTDLRARYGNLAFTITVVLEDDRVESEQFSFKLYRPMPPTVRPRLIDFGVVSERARTREFVISSALTPGSDGIEVLEEISESRTGVSCKLATVKSMRIRHANAEKDTVNFQAILVATAEPSDELGTFEGVFEIPVKCNGMETEVSVPFRGRYSQKFAFQPPKLVAVVPPNGRVKPMRVRLFRQGTTDDLAEVTISSDNPNVKVDYHRETGGADSRLAGTLAVSIDSQQGAKSFDSVIHLKGKTGKNNRDELSLTLPIKVRVVDVTP
jgi:peptidase C39-like protein/uncharacterized protein DUF1573